MADLLDTLDAEGVERCDGGRPQLRRAAGDLPGGGRTAARGAGGAGRPGHRPRPATRCWRRPRRPATTRAGRSREAALAARSAGRPEQALPRGRQDLAVALEHGEDGRYRLRFCRSAVITAWSEMARAAGLAGRLRRRAAAGAGAAAMTWSTPALRAALAADLGDRFREHGMEAGHMVYWDAFDELVEVLAGFLGRVPSTSERPEEWSLMECDVAVLGGGPGGYPAAIRAAQLGAEGGADRAGSDRRHLHHGRLHPHQDVGADRPRAEGRRTRRSPSWA